MEDFFHGTDKGGIQNILHSGVDPSLGGGELGQGFYTTDRMHTAKAWARNAYNSGDVLKFEVQTATFNSLTTLPLNYEETVHSRSAIKESMQTRTYQFQFDVVWGEIRDKGQYASQFKFESSKSARVLDGSTRSIV